MSDPVLPVITTVGSTVSSGTGTAADAQLPDGIAVDDILIAFHAKTGWAGTMGKPAAWNTAVAPLEMPDASFGGAGTLETATWWKKADAGDVAAAASDTPVAFTNGASLPWKVTIVAYRGITAANPFVNGLAQGTYQSANTSGNSLIWNIGESSPSTLLPRDSFEVWGWVFRDANNTDAPQCTAHHEGFTVDVDNDAALAARVAHARWEHATSLLFTAGTYGTASIRATQPFGAAVTTKLVFKIDDDAGLDTLSLTPTNGQVFTDPTEELDVALVAEDIHGIRLVKSVIQGPIGADSLSANFFITPWTTTDPWTRSYDPYYWGDGNYTFNTTVVDGRGNVAPGLNRTFTLDTGWIMPDIRNMDEADAADVVRTALIAAGRDPALFDIRLYASAYVDSYDDSDYVGTDPDYYADTVGANGSIAYQDPRKLTSELSDSFYAEVWGVTADDALGVIGGVVEAPTADAGLTILLSDPTTPGAYEWDFFFRATNTAGVTDWTLKVDGVVYDTTTSVDAGGWINVAGDTHYFPDGTHTLTYETVGGLSASITFTVEGNRRYDITVSASLWGTAPEYRLYQLPEAQTIEPLSAPSQEVFGNIVVLDKPFEPEPEFKRGGYHKYSGIEINQNPTPTTLEVEMTHTFNLPRDFKRGSYIPDLSGIQLCMNVADPDALKANLTLEVDSPFGWTKLVSGSVLSSHVAGERVWVDFYFSEPVRVLEGWLNRPWRFSVYSPFAPLQGTLDSATFVPNFRLLALTADSDEDFLGNKYRAVVMRSAADRFNTQASDQVNGYWLSKPNPSKYAVECLYFDVRGIDDRPSVVDRVLLDPITPGMWFHVYYTDEGEPGATNEEWEQKLWTPVARSFQADRREEHALPEPIAAKYICIEFSHLQAQHYSPGTFQQPIRYRKHPKWVLDYFLARLSALNDTEDPFVARRVKVVYDAFELAYDYYVDDLHNDPTHPEVLLPSDSRNVTPFFAERADISDQVDSSTLDRIKLSLRPYQEHPARAAKGLDYLPSLYSEAAATNNYPVEKVTPARADTSQVSTLDRGNLIVEQNYPVMFFYLASRHQYRVVEASFREDRAYFAGVRELAFTREHYATASDTPLYVETLGDSANVVRNDFIDDGYPGKLGGDIAG